MAEANENLTEVVETLDEKAEKQQNETDDTRDRIETEYDVESLANSGLFCSKSIVRAALRSAGKKKATIAEAKRLVENF